MDINAVYVHILLGLKEEVENLKMHRRNSESLKQQRERAARRRKKTGS